MKSNKNLLFIEILFWFMDKVMLPYKYYLFLLIFHFYSNFQLKPKQEIIQTKP